MIRCTHHEWYQSRENKSGDDYIGLAEVDEELQD